MQEIDKAAMGRRVKQIRLEAGLRQWELARMLGTTQSAVHKYEHGVVPEPRRLVELARIGKTSVEWVLTGQHWENGSEQQERLGPELLRTAALLREVQAHERASVDEALRIVRAALAALSELPESSEEGQVPVGALRSLSSETIRLLEAAWRIQRAVVLRVLEGSSERLESSGLPPGGPDSSGREPAT
jgi:transcriptional regulator with XRE-family HTH domain